jgi:hypothetical protein
MRAWKVQIGVTEKEIELVCLFVEICVKPSEQLKTLALKLQGAFQLSIQVSICL